jgi:putative alpha-1,2-mannosidase
MVEKIQRLGHSALRRFYVALYQAVIRPRIATEDNLLRIRFRQEHLLSHQGKGTVAHFHT